MKTTKLLVLIAIITCYGFILAIVLPLQSAGQTKNSEDAIGQVQPLMVEDAYGHKTNAAQQKGKVVFINFWSLTCVPCKAEMPTINHLQMHYKDDTDLQVYAVDLDHNFHEDYTYFAKKGYSLGIYAPSGVVPTSLFKGELPTTVVIDKNGNIARFQAGQDHYDTPEFFHFIDSLLSE